MTNLAKELKSDKLALPDLLGLLRSGSFSELMELIIKPGLKALPEPERDNLLAALIYWKNKLDASQRLDRYLRSEFLLKQWDEFLDTTESRHLSEGLLYALKYYIYQQALTGYLELYNLSEVADPFVLKQLGLIYKGLGNYESALASLELALTQSRQDARIMFLLADCYALVGDETRANLFFREAFFLDPEAFELQVCEAPAIRELVNSLQELGLDERELKYWIPIYANLEGLFNIKRELKPLEIGRLTQAILELEEIYKKNPDNCLKALLLNRYFWLIDHYRTIKAPLEDLEELLLKIKRLDAKLFAKYIL